MSRYGPNRKKSMSMIPTITAMLVLIILIGLIWFVSKSGLIDLGSSSGNCGSKITEDLYLDSDLICASDNREQNEPSESSALNIDGSSLTIDCNMHAIQGDSGIGILVENRQQVTIQNCRLQDISVGILAREVSSIIVQNCEIDSTDTGIIISGSDHFQLISNKITGLADQAKQGVEVTGCKEFEINKNKISNFLMSGINLYGSQVFKLYKNTITNIRDTGIGFFKGNNLPATGDGLIKLNEISEVKKVGAFEVMYGSHDLEFNKNRVNNTASGLVIYKKGKSGKNRNIKFHENFLAHMEGPFKLSECQNISLTKNLVRSCSGSVMISADNANSISIIT